MNERDVVARTLWAYRTFGWRLHDVYEVGAGRRQLRRYWLRAPGAMPQVLDSFQLRTFDAPLKERS